MSFELDTTVVSYGFIAEASFTPSKVEAPNLTSYMNIKPAKIISTNLLIKREIFLSGSRVSLRFLICTCLNRYLFLLTFFRIFKKSNLYFASFHNINFVGHLSLFKNSLSKNIFSFFKSIAKFRYSKGFFSANAYEP